MWAYTSVWGAHETFKLIPITKDCPFVEMIFDPESKVLVVISKTAKQSMHMLPRLDDNGDPMMMKLQPRQNGKNYKEERRVVETFLEYYISNKEEIKKFIEMFAVNHAEFDFSKAMDMVIEQPKQSGPVLQP